VDPSGKNLQNWSQKSGEVYAKSLQPDFQNDRKQPSSTMKLPSIFSKSSLSLRQLLGIENSRMKLTRLGSRNHSLEKLPMKRTKIQIARASQTNLNDFHLLNILYPFLQTSFIMSFNVDGFCPESIKRFHHSNVVTRRCE
jgi:hypothetical protein